MPVPLVIAAPAAAASLAYINAKASVWYDARLLSTEINTISKALWRSRNGRVNFFYVLEGHATTPKTAAKNMLLFEGKAFTYAEVYDNVLRYAHWLKTQHGVKPRDIVAMNFQNSHQFVFLWYALWALGAKPAFINYNLTGKSLTHSIKSSTTRLCIVDPHVEDKVTEEVKSELADVTFLTLHPNIEAQIQATDPVRPSDEDREEKEIFQMAILIYTSGTTGLPKPAVVSWAKVLSGSNVGSRLLERGNDIMYTSMPLYHSSASILSLCATVGAGSTQALGRKFSTKLFWSEVRAMDATMIQYVGETLRYLLAAPPQIDPITGENMDKKHNVQLAFGNGLRPDVWNRFKERFGIDKIAEFFAATEAPFGTWILSSNDYSVGAIGRMGWIRQAISDINLACVEVDWNTDAPRRDPKTGFCTRCKSNQPGEMLCRLDPKDIKRGFQGYFNNETATSSKVIRDVFKKGDAYYRSGDVCKWDRTQGLLYFHDRIGDTFRWKSENVSTFEVAEALGRHPRVHEANVYGVSLPHHDGRAGCVAVALDQSLDALTSPSAKLSPSDLELMHSIATHIDASLPRYARPLFIRILNGVADEASTTGTNKQQKSTLRLMGVLPNNTSSGDVSGSGEKKVDVTGKMFWRSGDTFVEFGEKDWTALQGGSVKL